MSSCEIFRFYKLITTKSLIEPVSMIVPRRVRAVGATSEGGRSPSWRRRSRSLAPMPRGSRRRLVAPPQRGGFLRVLPLPPLFWSCSVSGGTALCSGPQFPPLTEVGGESAPQAL